MRSAQAKLILWGTLVCALCQASLATATRVPMSTVGRTYGYPKPAISDNTMTLRSRYSRFDFTHGNRKIIFNGTVVMMNDAFKITPGSPSIAKVDLESVINPLLRPQDVRAPRRTKLVVLDPGHGGADGGMKGNGLQEKGLVLDIAKRVSDHLVAARVPVRLTRYGDHTISLNERVRRATRWQAAVFVSIHINAASNKNAAGFETFVVPAKGFTSTSSSRPDKREYAGNRHDAENTALAYQVHRSMLNSAPGADRGIKRARYVVIRDAPCPAVLVECGFATNRTEAKRLARSDHRAKIASGIAKGILRYYEVAGRD